VPRIGLETFTFAFARRVCGLPAHARCELRRVSDPADAARLDSNSQKRTPSTLTSVYLRTADGGIAAGAAVQVAEAGVSDRPGPAVAPHPSKQTLTSNEPVNADNSRRITPGLF
jgi:hypothetical protein